MPPRKLLGMVGRTCLSLSPTHPPLAPVRPRPSASSGARSAGQLAAPPPRPRGLQYQSIPIHKEHPSSLAGTLLRSVPPLRREPALSLPYAR